MTRALAALLFAAACAGAQAAPHGGAPPASAPTTAAPPPRLVVLCSVDQLATWVFAEARPHLAPDGGFARLLRDGTELPECAYAHACTETGPGHATIGTGVAARVHGIVRNAWWDRDTRTRGYCVDEPVAPLPDLPEGRNRGPGKLLAPTLAGALKAHVPGALAGSIAWKDRSAILMAGPHADVAVWCEAGTGNFVTNTAWVKHTPPWLHAWNAQRAIDALHGTVWERTGPDAAYAGLVDDRPYETAHANGSGARTLPQPLTGASTVPGATFRAQVYASPFGNTIVRRAAEAMVEGMGLGADATPDLLCVGFSSTDVVGHTFGPDSVEARDALLRLDRELATFLAFLDARVGAGQWALFLTADHGVGPTPEWARAQGRDAGRGAIQTFAAAAIERAVAGVAGGPPPEGKRYLAHVGEYSAFFDDAALDAVRGERPLAQLRLDAARAAAAAARRVRGIAAAFATEDLLAPGGAPDELRRSLVDACCPGRAGEVQLVIQPYWLDGTTPASHGTPHDYDRRVVGIAVGGGAPAGAVDPVPCTPGFGAVWFARLLGLPGPAHATDEVPSSFQPPR
jgi:hypothetical protein